MQMDLLTKCLWFQIQKGFGLKFIFVSGKIVMLSLFGFLSAFLFFSSLRVDYKFLLAEEHVRFRSGFPSQANWITSPYGTLNCYLFNVTNSEAFLKGEDDKLKMQEIGPIVYHVKGRNQVLEQTDNSVIYRKIRYHSIEFDPEASCSPDILNQTIVMPNLVLLGAAAKLHDWVFLLRHAFNAITNTEPVFLNRSVYYFLWDFTTPGLDLLSNYVPNIVANCGMLYNALRKKDEVYNVKVGLKEGMKNFFRVNTLNKKTYFPEQIERLKYLNNSRYKNLYCPIEVSSAFDNSVFPPLMDKNSSLTIVAAESCRTLQLRYNNTVNHLGFSAYQYIITDEPEINSCLDKALGIKLHSRMFDVSKCLFNDVPSAFSSPHFYGSSYDWKQHFEGLSPNEELHEASIVIEPTTGIPIEEKYRFQSNIPMPKMDGYSKDLQKFSNMVIPTFWYEYDLDDLPMIVLLLMRLNIYGMPIIQPIFIIIFMFLTIFFFLKSFLIFKGCSFKEFVQKNIFDKGPDRTLETTFETCLQKDMMQTKM